jgi:hypothetical protein
MDKIFDVRVTTDTVGGLMDEHAAAAFLGYTVRALRNWRLRGGGPQFVKVSAKSVRYQRQDLQAWIDARLRTGPRAGLATAPTPQHAPRRSKPGHDPTDGKSSSPRMTPTPGLESPLGGRFVEMAF